MDRSPLSSKAIEDFFSKVQPLIDTQMYFLNRMKEELQSIKDAKGPSSEDLLKATAYICAHGGYNDLAVHELNALISTSSDNIHHHNKLAQVYLRRGKDGDYTKALEISSLVLNSKSNIDNGDVWLANHNAALASYALDRNADAASYCEAALGFREDPRTRAILDQIRAPSTSDTKFFSFASGEPLTSGQPIFVAGMSVMEM